MRVDILAFADVLELRMGGGDENTATQTLISRGGLGTGEPETVIPLIDAGDRTGVPECTGGALLGVLDAEIILPGGAPEEFDGGGGIDEGGGY